LLGVVPYPDRESKISVASQKRKRRETQTLNIITRRRAASVFIPLRCDESARQQRTATFAKPTASQGGQKAEDRGQS